MKLKENAMTKQAILSYLKAAVATALLIFLSAGTVYYWQGWIFMALFFIPMAFIAVFLFKCSPELFKRRLDTKEKNPGQSIIAKLFYVSICLFFVISGLDKRYNWSAVPFVVVVISDILFFVGYSFLFLAFKENKYLSHTITVAKDQHVVTTGHMLLCAILFTWQS